MELRQRLEQLPPRSESRQLLVQETAQLYGSQKVLSTEPYANKINPVQRDEPTEEFLV